ncbi:hypothetical protein [Hymenobacter sp.]|uniref:hypothetical protein n=1 Tax=Hymenobacter sp. TaxID=1898978 RepID=UPI00286C9BB2|nr:hypothetical protein [Hymenobacter sp.]
MLYRKAPVLLVDFMALMGEPRFFALLKATHQQRVATTADLLSLVETTVSAGARQQLETLLKQ